MGGPFDRKVARRQRGGSIPDPNDRSGLWSTLALQPSKLFWMDDNLDGVCNNFLQPCSHLLLHVAALETIVEKA